MPPLAILAAVVQYGPSILPMIQSLITMIENKQTTVTAADIQQLIDLGKKTSADYLNEAGGLPAQKATS